MMRKFSSSTISVVGTFLLIAVLSGCGGGTTATTQPTTISPTIQPAIQASAGSSATSSASTSSTGDPCTVITASDAATFLGAPSVAPMSPKGGSQGSICIYSTADSEALLSVTLLNAPDGAAKSDAFTAVQRLNKAVTGLGDAAYFDDQLGTLGVAKGKWVLTLNGTVGGKVATLDQLTAMAKIALSRLP